jgi:hypothetical protein
MVASCVVGKIGRVTTTPPGAPPTPTGTASLKLDSDPLARVYRVTDCSGLTRRRRERSGAPPSPRRHRIEERRHRTISAQRSWISSGDQRSPFLGATPSVIAILKADS